MVALANDEQTVTTIDPTILEQQAINPPDTIPVGLQSTKSGNLIPYQDNLYTKQTATNVLSLIISTTMTMAQLCKSAGIHTSVWYLWLSKSPSLMECHTRAWSFRSIHKVEETSEKLAELQEYVEKSSDDPRDKHVRIQLQRLMSDNTRWLASKYNPRLFGDKQQIEQKQLNVHVVADKDQIKDIDGGIEDLLLSPDKRNK